MIFHTLNHRGSQRMHRGTTEALCSSVNTSVLLCGFSGARGVRPAHGTVAACKRARRFDRQPLIAARSARVPQHPAHLPGGTHE